MEIYVLKNKKTGKWIDLDSASGGYPYDVDNLLRAYKFTSKDGAERYIAVGSSRDYNEPPYELHRLTFSTEQVEQRTGKYLEDLRHQW